MCAAQSESTFADIDSDDGTSQFLYVIPIDGSTLMYFITLLACTRWLCFYICICLPIIQWETRCLRLSVQLDNASRLWSICIERDRLRILLLRRSFCFRSSLSLSVACAMLWVIGNDFAYVSWSILMNDSVLVLRHPRNFCNSPYSSTSNFCYNCSLNWLKNAMWLGAIAMSSTTITTITKACFCYSM